MFQTLTERLGATLDRVRGKARLSEENIRDAVRQVRQALLEADVALSVVTAFIERVKAKAINQQVMKSLTPGQMFIKVVRDELVLVLGQTHQPLKLAQAPAVILMAGLQGAGKTTTVAKLARMLKEEGKRVLVASGDVYRPAAIEQLRVLAEQVDVEFYATDETRPTRIAEGALDNARRRVVDVLIFDTAGRLAIDQQMMAEVKTLHQVLGPQETLFVVDAMTGQDAVLTAKTFNEHLDLTGVIVTKTDGDARGGAVLSIRHVTGRPVKYVGVSEKPDGLERFHPDRVASRILGMGDVLSLVEDVTRKVDQEKAQELAKKMVSGQRFDLADFREQLLQMQNMGGVKSLMEKLPGMAQVPDAVKDQVDDRKTRRMIAIINSMTLKERAKPDLLNASRKRRIAGGSGTQVQEINQLLKQYELMQKMMSKFQRGGMRGLMRAFSGKVGGGPPAGLPSLPRR